MSRVIIKFVGKPQRPVADDPDEDDSGIAGAPMHLDAASRNS